MSEKLCVFCDHLAFVTDGCTSDYYVGDVIDSAGVECLKGVWSLGGRAADQPFNGWGRRRQTGFEIHFAKGDLAVAIQRAKTCKHYCPPTLRGTSQGRLGMSEKCGYDIPWFGKCKNERPCKDHAHLRCVKCKEPATHACPTMGQFMCGAPLCPKHPRCCR